MKPDKIKKMEELRKRLQSMNQEQFSQLLDTSNDIEQWQIDFSQKARENRLLAYQLNPKEATTRAANARKNLTSSSRKKQGAKMKQWHENAIDHKDKLRENFTGENNPCKKPKVLAKKKDTFRTTGRVFIELNSRSFGYVSDIKDQFKISKSQAIHLATNQVIPKRGKAVGLLIRFYDKTIHPPFSELNDIRIIKK